MKFSVNIMSVFTYASWALITRGQQEERTDALG